VGIFAVDWNVFSQMSLPAVKPFTVALLLALFAFSGFEIIVIPGAEMINAKRILPLGLLIGTGITIVIYMLIQIVCVGTFPNLSASLSPIAEASTRFLGSKAVVWITAGAMFSILGTLTSLLLAGPRILYAMSLSHQMPQIFSRVHSRFRTPYIAIIFYTLLGLGLSLSSTFQDLATLSVMVRLITYIGCAAAVPILRKKMPTPHAFQIPGGITVPLLTIALSLFAMTAATQKNLISGSIALLVGFILYFFTGFKSRTARQVSNIENQP
jgi:amino acid transporter